MVCALPVGPMHRQPAVASCCNSRCKVRAAQGGRLAVDWLAAKGELELELAAPGQPALLAQAPHAADKVLADGS